MPIRGEELAIILPDATVDQASRRADDIREKVKQLSLSINGKTLGRITISIGAAAFPLHGRTTELLLRAADKAPYESKQTGRDRVSVAPQAIQVVV